MIIRPAKRTLRVKENFFLSHNNLKVMSKTWQNRENIYRHITGVDFKYLSEYLMGQRDNPHQKLEHNSKPDSMSIYTKHSSQ